MRQKRRYWPLLALLLGLLLLGLLGNARTARALVIDDDGLIGAGEVIDDDVFISCDTALVEGTINGNLIVSSNDATIDGTVNGDLIVTGAEATVNGRVSGSLAYIGRRLTVNGAVEGSIYAAGASLILGPTATAGRNVLFAGFSLEAQAGSTVGRDVRMGGYQALLAGQIDQDVDVDVNALDIEGSIDGDVQARVSAPEEGGAWRFRWPGMPDMVGGGIRVSREAQIDGTLTYTSAVEQAEAIQAAPGGGIVYQEADEAQTQIHASLRWQIGQWFLARLREFITLLVLGGLAIWKAPQLMNRLADQARARPLPALGWGALAIVVGVVGAVALALVIAILWIVLGVATFGGLAGTVSGVGFSGLGLAVSLFALAVVYGSKLVVAYLVGRLILRRLAPQKAEKGLWPLILGIVLYLLVHIPSVLGLIPPLTCVFMPLGWLLEAAVTLIGLGAMWLVLREWRRARRVQMVPAVVNANLPQGEQAL